MKSTGGQNAKSKVGMTFFKVEMQEANYVFCF